MENKISPITYAQQGVYVECILDPDNLRYNLPTAYSFPKGIEAEAVCDAMKKVMECHPTLFSHFEDRNGEIVQVYAEKCEAQVNVTETPDEQVEARKKSFARVFDLSHGPLYRAEILDTPSGAVLLYDAHHLVNDGASIDVLTNELCKALEGKQPVAEQSAYSDFAKAQKESAIDHKTYYDKMFAKGVESTMLSGDLNGEEGQRMEHTMVVSTEDVMAKAKALGTAPSALFMAAAFYTLSRYTNSKDLCLTTISNGRQNTLSKGIVGMFVNTIPIVSTIEDVSVTDYIHGVRKMFQETREHEEYPFASIVNDYGVEQKVRFTYQYGTFNLHYYVNGEELHVEYLWTNSQSAPITITICGIGDIPAITVNYDSSKYSADFVSRFAESMDAVVAHFLAAPEARLLSTSIMSEKQEKEVSAMRHTCIDPAAVRFPLFHNSIEYWAEQTPDATAIIACNETLTYRQFNEKANILAHALINKGVVPGDRICLLLPRKSWHLIAMFGVMKAGAAYIPCDPEYPAERIKLITEDSHARYVITTEDKMADYGDRALNIENILATVPEASDSLNPAIEQSSDSLAYLIYTSGSTGRPKGVMLRHIGICNYLTDHEENRHFHALVHDCKTMLCITTVSFDLSLKEIGASLFNGMTLVFANEEQVNDPMALAELMQSTGVDGFSGTPSRLKMFLDLPDFQKAFAQCKFIILGGEKYPPTLLPQVKELAPGARLFNTYGPTEISVSCNGKELTHADHITIGKPLLNVKEYVVDNDLNELPVGVTGELLIGGLGVSAGYNDLPDKTAEAFIDYNGERYYKSGDYAYWNEDGEVIILGRKDNQIKLNGLRIELGEVETVLNKQPQVKEGVVMIKTVEGHDHLVAYYVLSTDSKYPLEGDIEGLLKEQMATSLTHYMVPTIFVKMDKMPISPNGKTDLKALPEPTITIAEEDKVMPATPEEQGLYDIVADIIGNTNFGTTTNLISVGLTSLLAIRFSVLVYQKMNASLAVRDILRCPTIKELAGKLTVNGEQATVISDTPSLPESAPLSFSQLGIYAECMANPQDIQYNMPKCITMPQGVTAQRLKEAIEKVVDAHRCINTYFHVDENGDAHQCLMDSKETDIPVITMTEEQFLQEKEDFVRPFDLNKGPLYRFEIVETPDALYMLQDFHHLIMDGASTDVFLSHLCKALDGQTLEKEGYDYYQFVNAQKIEDETETFFANQMTRIEEASALIPDRYDGDDSHCQAKLTCSTDLKEAQKRCSQLGITPAAFYLAAVMITVSKYTAEENVGICTISNGRSNLNISETFGMFVNTLPLVGCIDGAMKVDDYLRQVADNFLDTMAHEDYPYGKIAEKYSYIANIIYGYQVGVFSRYACKEGELEIGNLNIEKAKFPVSVFVEGSMEKGGVISVEYDMSLFTKPMIRGFAETVQHVTKELLTKEFVSDITVCNEQMMEKLDSFNEKDNPTDLPADDNETVLTLFHKAAQQYPDNIAVVFKDKQYTYKELDELTDKLGAYVYTKVKDCDKQEPVVSIIIHRNEWMVLASLAALKAGCAYQPLDPSYPQERLNFMVKDADAALLIADEDLRQIVNEYEGEVLLTNNILADATEYANSNPNSLPHSEGRGGSSLFTLLYTSGSTGVPKGVMLEHGNLIAFSKGYCSYLSINSESKIAAYASFGFDANMQDIYCTLMNGATLHIIDEDIRLDLEALHQYFEKEGITHSFMTTQVAVQYLETYPQSACLQHLMMGGEKLRAVKPELLSYEMHNGYGPSETTCGCSFFTVKHWEPNIPIGKPTLTCNLYIVDKYGHRLPVGAPGELWINGPQVGRGYLNRPDKSAESFTPNPFDDGRVYHSGDIVRYREDGNIEFVGRKDGQVKIRGFRIELKEVEAVIRDFEGIKDVTVQAFDDPNGGKFIAAYIVSDSEVNVNVLNNFILDQKPPYMVPAITMQIEKIPLNVNQKVDKKALPKPEVQTVASEQDTTPLNELQTQIKAIIASVVNTENFGLNDILGYVGLTSISSIKLGTLLYNKFGIRVNTKNLAKRSSIKTIEEEIHATTVPGAATVSGASASGSLVSQPQVIERPTSAPLSFSQLGVYSECVANPESVVYNIPFCLDMPAGVTVNELNDALLKVIEAHPYLNTQFRDDENGDTIQFQPANTVPPITVVKMTLQELEHEKQAFVRPFELKESTLYRIQIVECPDTLHLLVDVHHLVMDGGSIDVFLNDLCKALDGNALKAEPYDYYQFVQEQKIDEEVDKFFEEQVGQIEDASSLLPDLYETDDEHSKSSVECNTDLAAVAEKCRKLNITPAAFYLAAVQIAVSKYTAEDLVGICTISNGRSNLLIAESFGMFVNTLPIVANVDSAMSVEDYLKQTADVFSQTIDHEDYPFARVVEKFGYAANIMYAYQVGVLNRYVCGKGEVKMLSLELPIAKFPVYVAITGNTEKGGTVCVMYDESLFSKTMMQGFAAAIEQIAKNLLTCETVGQVEVSNQEMLEKLDSFNAHEGLTISPADEDETVLSLFQKAAKQYPDNIAAVFKEKQYTYKQLDELTDKIGALIYNKVGTVAESSEPVVSILIPRNEYMFILPLAVMKAGCAYQPLDPSYPQERLNFMVKDADAALLIADEELKDIVNEYEGEVLLSNNIIEKATEYANSYPNSLPHREGRGGSSLFILLYTSGSTGVPKGVMLEHQNLVSFIKWYRRYYDLKPEHNVAAYASFGFDANMMDMYPALTTGATLHVIAEEIRLDLVALNEYYDTHNVTHSFITTQVGVQFLQNAENHSLHHLSVGGEKLVSVDPAQGYTFHNAYGPTECTIFTTTFPVQTKEPNIPIGKPTDLLECYVMDKNLHRLPVGAAGELIIVGKQVGRGYLNRPDKTAEAFFTYNGKRAYHSGDIVRYREDGNIEFVGRKDGQVKIRGFRIELKEVESVIRDFPGISNVTVQAFDDPNGGKFIAAYVVSDSEVDVNALNNFILDQKPPYMVPAVTMQIPEIPLNVNQKVDKKALPKPETTPLSNKERSGESLPLNALETELKAIIVSIVNTEEFGVTDMLGYVGLTSISGIKLASLIYKRFGIKIPTKNLSRSTLFDIEQILLQNFLTATVPGAATVSAVTLPGATTVSGTSASGTLTEAPLTFSQQGVYMDCQMNPDTTMYNIPMMLTFPESVTAEALADAVQKVAQMHTALFCNFYQTADGVVMRKAEDMTLEVPVKTLTNEEIEAEKAVFVRPFDLEHDRLARAEIIVQANGKKSLMLDMHHLVSDGGSLDLFVNQLIALLNGQDITPETYDYLRFAVEQKAKADNGGMREDKEFFDNMFAQYEATATVPVNKTSTEEGMPCETSTAIPDDIMNAQLPEGVSKAHFWFAVFNYALSRFANTKDVYTAFISNGRQYLDIVDTVGMFVNTLPCAVHVKDQTVEEFLKEVSKTFSDVIDHEDYPFARIAADYDFKGSASFAYQLGVQSDYVVNGSVVTEESGLTLNKAKIALSIYIMYVDGVPSVMAQYDDSQYTDDLMLHFTESMVAVAEHFMADLTAKVKNVSIMSERQRLEVEAMHSVNEDMSFPIRTFHEGIEQWAVKTPDALALMACDRDMTYREYNAEANQMARALMARGMKYGDRVVLLLPRRSYYLTALFAVMKCGGAFIPMDPEYPADRIAYILDDSEGRFVITTPEKVADYPDRAIDIFQLMEEAKAQPSENLDVKVDPHDLAYLIYTSGSTGRPKGVMIEHLGAASFLTFYKSDTNFGADSNANRVGLCQSTVSFDLSVGEIGVQVFNGDTVAFANEDEMMSPVEMIKLCRRTGAQTISGTPSRLAVNLELGEYYDLIKDQMKCVVTGGEKLPGALLDELEKMNVYIINTYGPTETTMGSSAGVLNGTREVHVGKPFTNYTYQVLDSDRNELPVGVMGELCIGGIGLARGYNNMPERTAETFIEWQGKRIYRTGDYAMWTKDGNIIIMGRTDNQVKLNGLRIELGEIETVMSQQPGMRQCVAIIKKLGNIDKLIGYYTVDETVANIPVADYEEQVRADMSVKLTPYMVPGIFVRLDEMPLTPVGKTDVKRLPMPDLQTGEYVAPKNDVEKTFCEIFAKILNLKRISATDNFFELGGTSLVAMQLIGEASKVGYSIVYKTIFDNATPRLLARLLKPELYKGEDTQTKMPMADEIEAYDYSQLDDILAANTIDNFRSGKCYEQMGNVMLAGATGFLGIHVLHNLIERDDVPHIYCLVRSNKILSAESRVRTLLYYYFNEAYEQLFENGRITVIEGDVTNAEVFGQFNEPIDVVINCAANVKHFSAGTDIEDINIKGCQNCIDLCVRTGARFIQTSTGSIAGNTVSDTAVAPIIFTERDLYHNQELTTKYAASKFLAERSVLDAVKNRGLKGKIMRLGNLSARSTDGEFQINFRSNNAMATLKAFQVLGCIPYEREFGYSEFSPINEVADAIVRLSLTPDCCTIFQPGNIHWPPYGDVIECMNRIGVPIERVEQEEFQKRLAEAMGDPDKSDLVQSLVAYREAGDGRVHVMNGWDTKAYTGQVLLRLGFRWSFTTWDYVERYLECLQGLGVFDEDFKR